MKTPHILPSSCPDIVDDVAHGATFYLDASDFPAHEGLAFLRCRPDPGENGVVCVRLLDGRRFEFPRTWCCRVTELDADTSNQDW